MQLQEFIQVFGQRFRGLIDNQGIYNIYRVPNPEAPYPQDYIIDQQGIVRYWSDEYDPQEIIRVIDRLLGGQVREEQGGSPTSPVKLTVTPNPGSADLRITYYIDESARSAQIHIIDGSGRVVRQFNNISVGQSSTMLWRGDDNSACELSAGVYFVRVSTDKGIATEQIVLTR